MSGKKRGGLEVAAARPILASDVGNRLGAIIRRLGGKVVQHDSSPRLPSPPRPSAADLADAPTLWDES